jgi:predicted RNA-binding protein with PUA-like domain
MSNNIADDSVWQEFFPNPGNKIRGTYVSSRSNIIENNTYRFYTYLEAPLNHMITVQCLKCIVPYSFYQITNSRNTFQYYLSTSPSTPIMFSITEGNYNADDLMKSLNNAQSDLIFTYSSITGKCTITAISTTFLLDLDDKDTTMLEILGFQNNITPTSGIPPSPQFQSVMIGNNTINVQPRKCLCVHLLTGNLSNFVHSGTHTSETRSLCCVPLTTEQYFDVIVHDDMYGDNFGTLQDNHLTYFDIQFMDEFQEVIEFKGGSFTLILEFSFSNR